MSAKPDPIETVELMTEWGLLDPYADECHAIEHVCKLARFGRHVLGLLAGTDDIHVTRLAKLATDALPGLEFNGNARHFINSKSAEAWLEPKEDKGGT